MLPAQNPSNFRAVDATPDTDRPDDIEGRTAPVGRRRRLRLAGVALGVAAALAVASPASADPFGLYASGSGPIPDNFNHTYCFSGSDWTTAWRNVVDTQMANLDTQTSYTDNTGEGCTSITDVRFQLSSTIAARGDYRCTSFNTGDDGIAGSGDEECESAIIRINSTSVLPDDHQRRKTACHEIGHSVGLAHGSNAATYWNDCMLSGAVAAGIQWERYNAHHIAHANSRTPSSA